MTRVKAKRSRKPMSLARRIRRTILTVLTCIGLSVMAYPFACNLYFMYQSTRLTTSYDEMVESQPDEELERMWAEAVAWNQGHLYNVIDDPFADDPRVIQQNAEYDSLLNPTNDRVMGYVDIPKIGQRLAIYHDTDPDGLLKGAVHLQGTSLPVGGDTSHCVLSGHRGLATAALFTDLDQMREGDIVNIYILDHALSYEVDQILTVKPTEVEALELVPGEDLLTLVTCTPYAVNTHRLLVRGHRVPYVQKTSPVTEGLRFLTPQRLMLIAIGVLLGAVLVWLADRRRLRGGKAVRKGRHAA
ncbi:MAG: class C sortase [Atopobiaceae bacterium]|nr:class C sortase [Atopobiaceae bacterium]